MRRPAQSSARRMHGLAALLAGILVLGSTATLRAQTQPTSARQSAVDRFNRKIVTLAQNRDLSAQAVTRTLGVRLGPVKRETPYRFSWPILPNGLIAGGHVLKMGKHTNVEVRPRPGLKLTFEDVASAFLDVPYSRSELRAHVNPDSVSTRIGEVTHEFRVNAGVVRVTFPAWGGFDEPDHDARVLKEAGETADGRRNSPVDAVTVSDNLYKGWTSTLSLRTRRAIRGAPTIR